VTAAAGVPGCSRLESPELAKHEYNAPSSGDFWPHTWVVAGDLVISLTQEGAIPDDKWDRFVADISRRSTHRMLGIGIGAISVNTRQRRKLVQAMSDKRVAAVLGSSVARGIATALGWMGLKIRAFGWNSLPEAFEYLESPDLPPELGVEVVTELLRRAGAPSIEDLHAD
jgi:hypothetical protein